jgi:hypothetical protein
MPYLVSKPTEAEKEGVPNQLPSSKGQLLAD